MNEKNISKKAVRVKELHELRSESSKVFQMSDGTKQAIFYSDAVHVFDDERGEYVETNHQLEMETDGKHFVNKKGRFAARFNCEEENDELFSVEQGKYCVTVTARKGQHRKGLIPKLHKKIDKISAYSEKLVFENVEAGTDIEYAVAFNGVKESIIVKEKADNYRYIFDMHCKNVSIQVDKNQKRVAFLSDETGEEVFFIPEPFMQDADGKISRDVFYEVKDNGKGNIQLCAQRRAINQTGENPV